MTEHNRLLDQFTEIEWIIFDFGGVIINVDFKLTHEAFKALGIDNLDQKFTQTTQSGFFDRLEIAHASPDEFRAAIRKESNLSLSDQQIDAAWNVMLLDIPRFRIDILLELKKKYKIALLSNTNLIHYNYYRADLEKIYGYQTFDQIFDKTFFSHQIELRKPNKDIYEFVTSQVGTRTSQILFIDDTFKNIEAAQSYGWNTIFWKGFELDQLL